MTKPLYYIIILLLILIGCKTNTKKVELIVDAGSFLDSGQAKEIENTLRAIDKKGIYHLFLYTVIAEKYYKHKNYNEYLFNVLSKNDTSTNKNVLLYLAYDDKKIQIITGNKAREVLTDSLSQIGVNSLVPYFSQRQYYEGIKDVISYVDSIFMKSVNVR